MAKRNKKTIHKHSVFGAICFYEQYHIFIGVTLDFELVFRIYLN